MKNKIIEIIILKIRNNNINMKMKRKRKKLLTFYGKIFSQHLLRLVVEGIVKSVFMSLENFSQKLNLAIKNKIKDESLLSNEARFMRGSFFFGLLSFVNKVINYLGFQNDLLLNGVQDCRNDQDHQKRLGEMFRILEQLTMLIFF